MTYSAKPKSIVFFHAHPDDESIMTGGTMASESHAGSDVYLVTATNGSTDIATRDNMSDRPQSKREDETAASAEILGVKKTWFLGYRDSGMPGTTPNFDSDCWFQRDAFRAADMLTEICQEVSADILVGYEPNGTYGHPDHIKCHIVGTLAASALIKRTRFLWSSLNRDNYEMLRLYGEKLDREWVRRLTPEFWCPSSQITHKIDVTDFLDQKKASIFSHITEVDNTHFFATMTDEEFAECFGYEWYGEPGMKYDWRFLPDGEPVVYSSLW